MARGRLPVVVLPLRHALPSLDACLAALDRTLPAGAALRLVPGLDADPRLAALAEDWGRRAGFDARVTPVAAGEVAAVQTVLDEAPGADVVLLAGDAVPAGNWIEMLSRCADANPDVSALIPWSNRDELAAFPDPRASNALPSTAEAEAIAEAAAGLDPAPAPDLPPAVGGCVYLRRQAVDAVGGLDRASFHGPRGLDDLGRRAMALGWRVGLCARAFVGRQDGDAPRDPAAADDLPRLLARWPDHQARIAQSFLDDPLRALRERLRERLERLASAGPQRDLFA